MNIYTQKKRWKWVLFIVAAVIIIASLWYSNILVSKIAHNDRQRVQIWADAIQRRAKLVNYADEFFESVRQEEHKRVIIWAEAYRRLTSEEDASALTFYLSIISGNTTIPVILTDEEGNIKKTKNVEFSLDIVETLEGELLEEFSKYPPIAVKYFGITDYLYYKDSRLFSDLKNVLDDLIESFFEEVVVNTATVPVIVTDSSRTNILYFGGGLDSNRIRSDEEYARNSIKEMAAENKPIKIILPDVGVSYIFYESSFLLKQLTYYPYIQFFIIGLFLLVSYILFSFARKSEQNQVWVGLAKETAHQLGTPLSSMLAWMEMLKLKGIDEETLTDINKDITRLETVAQRFSKIGSPPKLEKTDIVQVLNSSIEYIKIRSSSNIKFHINYFINEALIVPVNPPLFEWVLENIYRNAIDAVEGVGTITVDVMEDNDMIFIDVTDHGKGIPKSKLKTVFNPGYTSKKRGWGLGLSLSKRIIENYHKGKIYVKSSSLNRGTTIRIMLKK